MSITFDRFNGEFKIVLVTDNVIVDMPGEFGISFFYAVYLADLYKKRNPAATFLIVSIENGDVMAEI